MTSEELCIALMTADTEEEVVDLLKTEGYWDNEDYWRYYGGFKNNYSQAGNQTSDPEPALVEKIVNSIDARLMGECQAAGIDPRSEEAPQNIRDAVASFFENDPSKDTAGIVAEWSPTKRTEVARGVTLCMTGYKPSQGNPSITVADCGEGQTPNRMPDTLLSLKEEIKMDIPFVQGRFDQGGTAALRFCGEKNLQLVISKRDPRIVDPSDPSGEQWGFTVVRREFPKGKLGSSVFTYLAPIEAERGKRNGKVLRFSAKSLPIFPEGQKPYSRNSEWGTLIKLYEFGTSNRTHMFLSSGLLERLDVLLPKIALPIRLHECRDYSGSRRSFETTLAGLTVRLQDDRAKNLENEYPTSHRVSVEGEELHVDVYAFRKGKGSGYRNTTDGILFTLNSQTQGRAHERFFTRTAVGMGYLKKDLLVIADCSNFSTLATEEFFMNSRDRLSGTEFRKKIETAVEELLKQHSGLRKLKEKRRRREVDDKLGEDKPLADVLNNILSSSPTLSKLFVQGQRIENPFKANRAEDDDDFDCKDYPTYFKLQNVDVGTVYRRTCHINRRARLFFETDACNDYFNRNIRPGRFTLVRVEDGQEAAVDASYSVNLYQGKATLNLSLPDNAAAGEETKYRAYVTDSTRHAEGPFENTFILNVKGPVKKKGGGGSKRDKGKRRGKGGREVSGGLGLPQVQEVYRDPDGSKDLSWTDVPGGDPFTQYSALRTIFVGEEETGSGENADVYDFYVNMNNVYLDNEVKNNGTDPNLIRGRFKYGMVLLGLGILNRRKELEKREETDSMFSTGEGIDEIVEGVSEAVAPILLPMIATLGELEIEEVTG